MRNGESSKTRGAPRPASLALVETFRDLPPEHLAELEQLLVAKPVSRGEVLMRQGDAADALYLVASGRFAVNVDGRRIAEVGVGSPIGEIGFFADGIRTATVTALRDSIVLKLPKEEFADFAERHPGVLKPIAVTLARRLADTLADERQSLGGDLVRAAGVDVLGVELTERGIEGLVLRQPLDMFVGDESHSLPTNTPTAAT